MAGVYLGTKWVTSVRSGVTISNPCLQCHTSNTEIVKAREHPIFTKKSIPTQRPETYAMECRKCNTMFEIPPEGRPQNRSQVIKQVVQVREEVK
jgi:hypothetical protein